MVEARRDPGLFALGACILAAVNIRQAILSDARAVAEVHVQSWRSAYRGLVPDEYLQARSVDQREAVWHSVIARATPVTLWAFEDNARAARFYRAAGFTADLASRRPLTVGGKELWEIRYIRKLQDKH
jgi:hypothetical protein